MNHSASSARTKAISLLLMASLYFSAPVIHPVVTAAGIERMKVIRVVKVIPIVEARSLSPDTVVTVEGVVTVPSATFKSSISDEGFAIQDRTGGIYVRMKVNLRLSLNRRVRVTGKLAESNGLLALEPAGAETVEPRGTGRAVQPEKVATGRVGETTEGRLLRVTGTITRAVVSDLPYGFRLFLDDGTGEIQVYVSASSGIDLSHLRPGQRVRATGLSGQYKDHYEVEPRFASDIRRLP